MALEEEMMQQEAAPQQDQGEPLSDEEEQDLDIAVNLAKNLLDNGGSQVIEEAANSSNDAGQVIGQFLMQMVSQFSEELGDVQLSPRIWFAYDGWVEQISDYIQEEYDIPAEIMDRAEMYIGTAARNMAAGKQEQEMAAEAAPPPPAQQAPVMPGGM